MRICIYTETALPKLGGQELVVDALARQFVEMGHQTSVLAPYPRHGLKLDDSKYPYQMRRHLRFYSTRWGVNWYKRFLLQHFHREKFDLLHCHGLYPSGYLAATLKDRLGIPLVLTSHGGDVREGNVRLRRPVIKVRHELAVTKSDRFVAIGGFTRAGFLRMGGVPEKIVNIPNGVDLAEFAQPTQRPPELPGDLKSHGYFLFIGRLVRRKGVDLLLDAMKLAPDLPFPLVIAGDGDEASDLHESAAEIKNRVHFVGRVGGATKRWLLQNSLCTILPSRSWEAFPLTVLESYAASRPMIASNIPGLSDLIRPNQTGLLIPENDATALANAMRQIAAHPTAAHAMGQTARQWANDFSWSHVAKQHIDLYESLLS
ncbi:MAG TPA: glycosyltransferase family 4 protein [Tepidisphaeraceae bacterium]|jgi:glycosyltransferase involved in cell wall biosynthesis